jgi:peroxiredoxin
MSPEARIVEYLQANLRPGQPLIVSKLFNEVFTSDSDRKALNRLFNTFFKIPLYVAQAQKAKGSPPSLKELSEQFAFAVPGQADVMLRIMESDPRVPKFLERDPKSGEILKADVDKILAHPRFGKILERTITGWEGNTAPAFKAATYDGGEVSLASFAGNPALLYFWFTNCPPCVKTSPQLAELHKKYGPSGLQIVGLNADRLLELDYTDADRAAYVAKVGATYTQAHLTAETQLAYGGVSVFPTMFVIDRKGVIVKHLVNAQEMKTLDDAIVLALK